MFTFTRACEKELGNSRKMPWELAEVCLLTCTFERSPKKWNLISWMWCIDLLIRCWFFKIWIKMLLWALGRHPLDYLAAAKERIYSGPISRCSQLGSLAGPWTWPIPSPCLGLPMGPVTSPGSAFMFIPQGMVPMGEGMAHTRSPPFLACLLCTISSAAWQTWERWVAQWQFIGVTAHRYGRWMVCLGLHPWQCR